MIQTIKIRFAAALCLSAGLLISGPAAHAANDQVYKFSIQTAVPNASLYFKLLEQFAQQIDTMSNGRLKAEVLAAGAVVGPFEILDAVSNNVVTAGYVWPNYFSGKNSAFVLFSNAPASTGLDQASMVAWYYRGGGEELYRELLEDVMGFNVKAFMVQPMGPDPLGWFKEPIESMEDFKAFKFRSPPGIPGETYQAMGISAVGVPGGEIVPSAQRGVIDAAEWIGPADDRNLGLQKIWKYYYLQGLHQQTDIGQVFVNGDFWESLPDDLKEIFRVAAKANIADTLDANIYDNAQAIHHFIDNEKVQVLDTPQDYYEHFITEEKKITAQYAEKNPFFKKVVDSQTEFARMVFPYRSKILTLYDNMVKTANEANTAE